MLMYVLVVSLVAVVAIEEESCCEDLGCVSLPKEEVCSMRNHLSTVINTVTNRTPMVQEVSRLTASVKEQGESIKELQQNHLDYQKMERRLADIERLTGETINSVNLLHRKRFGDGQQIWSLGERLKRMEEKLGTHIKNIINSQKEIDKSLANASYHLEENKKYINAVYKSMNTFSQRFQKEFEMYQKQVKNLKNSQVELEERVSNFGKDLNLLKQTMSDSWNNKERKSVILDLVQNVTMLRSNLQHIQGAMSRELNKVIENWERNMRSINFNAEDVKNDTLNQLLNDLLQEIFHELTTNEEAKIYQLNQAVNSIQNAKIKLIRLLETFWEEDNHNPSKMVELECENEDDLKKSCLISRCLDPIMSSLIKRLPRRLFYEPFFNIFLPYNTERCQMDQMKGNTSYNIKIPARRDCWTLFSVAPGGRMHIISTNVSISIFQLCYDGFIPDGTKLSASCQSTSDVMLLRLKNRSTSWAYAPLNVVIEDTADERIAVRTICWSLLRVKVTL